MEHFDKGSLFTVTMYFLFHFFKINELFNCWDQKGYGQDHQSDG